MPADCIKTRTSGKGWQSGSFRFSGGAFPRAESFGAAIKGKENVAAANRRVYP
jgi:hypothetical protein